MPDTFAPAPAAPRPARPSPLHTRPAGPAPGSPPLAPVDLLSDDPAEVPGAEHWSRPTPAPAGTHTERLIAGFAAVLAQMQQQARHATSTLRGQAFTGFARGSTPLSTMSLRLPGFRRWWAIYAGLLAAGTGAVLIVAQITFAGWQAIATQFQYGDIRTSHLAVNFGIPEEGPTTPSLVTAVNDGGTGHIYVLPGGQAAHASVVEIAGGDPAGQLPLLLTAADVDRDGHPDLLVQWGSTGPGGVFLFDTGTLALRPPTAEEQRRLYLPEAGR